MRLKICCTKNAAQKSREERKMSTQRIYHANPCIYVCRLREWKTMHLPRGVLIIAFHEISRNAMTCKQLMRLKNIKFVNKTFKFCTKMHLDWQMRSPHHFVIQEACLPRDLSSIRLVFHEKMFHGVFHQTWKCR